MTIAQDTPTRSGGVDTPDFREALAVWFKIGCINFGGPAGQIALMHRVLVDEKKWIDEPRFLHALNFCMLLPGPEAQQLATYVGWTLHGLRGGLAAGLLFILPGALVMLGLSFIYVLARGVPLVEGALYGIKAAVLVIVVEAIIRIGKRGLKTKLLIALAAAAFIGIFFLSLPFPLLVIAAGLIGYAVARSTPGLLGLKPVDGSATPPRAGRWREAGVTGAIWLAIWWAPVALAAVALGPGHVLVTLGVFFSKLAVVSFGGAYALLAYMAQQVVETHGWLQPREMVDALGLAETTPGPLILVTQFVSFLAAWRSAAPFDPGNRGGARRRDGDLDRVRAVVSVDFRRRAVHRGSAAQSETRRRAGGDHAGGGRRHSQSRGVVRAACAVPRGRGILAADRCDGSRSHRAASTSAQSC